MTKNPYQPALDALRERKRTLRDELDRLERVERDLLDLSTHQGLDRQAPREAATANGRAKTVSSLPADMTYRDLVLSILREAGKPLGTGEIMRRGELKGYPIKRTTLYWVLAAEKKEDRVTRVGDKYAAREHRLELQSGGAD